MKPIAFAARLPRGPRHSKQLNMLINFYWIHWHATENNLSQPVYQFVLNSMTCKKKILKNQHFLLHQAIHTLRICVITWRKGKQKKKIISWWSGKPSIPADMVLTLILFFLPASKARTWKAENIIYNIKYPKGKRGLGIRSYMHRIWKFEKLKKKTHSSITF